MRTLPMMLLLGCPFVDDLVGGDDKGDTGEPVVPSADLLLVIDNSSSMEDEASAIALAAESIVDTLAATGDWQIGVTSTTNDPSDGGGGTAGELFGEPVRLSDP